MELVRDILKEINNQRGVIETLTKEVSTLKNQVNSPKPVNLDSEKLANLLTPHMDTTLKAIQSKAQELTSAVSKIPKEINNREEWGIRTSTKVWLSVVFFSLLCGFWLAPKAVQEAEHKATKFQLERREQQIQEFKNKNPKSADKYFGF
jgi:hemerythrin-like domain-containing protein